MNITKEEIVSLLEAWIKQRPGLDPRDYGWGREGWLNYRSESRRITRQKRDAETLLRAVEYSGIKAPELLEAFRAYSGRLQIKQDGEKFILEYCTGQYCPTEYRAAACAVLASALWDYHRPDYNEVDNPGDQIRAMFKRRFGASIQRRWFD
jgi:hypothetical protein